MKINISDFEKFEQLKVLKRVCVWGVLRTSQPDQKAYPKIILMFGYLVTFWEVGQAENFSAHSCRGEREMAVYSLFNQDNFRKLTVARLFHDISSNFLDLHLFLQHTCYP